MSSRSLTAVLIALLLFAGSWQRAVGGAATQSITRPEYLVVIVMDGFRPDYLKVAPMRHLHQLMQLGTSYDNAWVGHLESTTPAGHATITTGAYPRKTGVIGFGWRDPITMNYTYAPTNLDLIKAGYLARTIHAGGVPTLAEMVHAQNKKDLVVSISGEKYYAAATLGLGADYQLYGWQVDGKFRPQVIGTNVPPARTHYQQITAHDYAFNNQDGFAGRLAARMVDTLHPRALLLNLPATDDAGHYYGGMIDTADMKSVLQGADSAISIVMGEYRKLGIFKKTLFVVTADHGMAANRHQAPIHAMYNTFSALLGKAQLDQEYRESLGAIWLTDPHQASLVASGMVAKHFPNIEGAFYKVQNGSQFSFEPEAATAKKFPPALLRAYLNLANTEASTNGADVLLPYTEDTVGFFTKTRKHWGKHGGFSWNVQHIPLVLEGPGVRHGVSHFPAKLVDVAPTIENLMGWQVPAGVDGVVLGDSTTQARGKQSGAQRAVGSGRMQDVEALSAHSAAQSRAK